MKLNAHQAAVNRLWELMSYAPSRIMRSKKALALVFRSAKSRRVGLRINATQVLSRIAAHNPRARRVLRGMRRDKNELVRHNAEILCGKSA